VADVDQSDHSVHGFGIVDLEGVVERERVHVDDRGLETDVGQQGHLVLDQLALGRHQVHGHLEPLTLGVQDLEVQLHVVHVEWNVLLGLPADHLAGVGFLHPIHRDLLDDHVAAADGGYDVLGLDAGRRQALLDGLGHDTGVHDFPLDDRVVTDRGKRDLRQYRTTSGVRDGNELDQAATDVQPDGRCLAPEESHTCPQVEEASRYRGGLRATDVPHKLQFGNRLRRDHLTGELPLPCTRLPRPLLLFRKRSLCMQHCSKHLR
jgi:hypothetical protein